ncbi:SEFIR domain protein [Clostridium phage D-1873]|uniref:SEFIR domain protein n=1 Tax=Clostridium botulinum D str. 1873 TaxID=592027 RepID=A0A9P2G5N2_CLOBO|nr:SEFIR domain protein [Clostridium phage D-1873]
MYKENNSKKVFISYSWSSEEYSTWVRLLAERLIGDGIEVILDQWDLKAGYDKFAFMEQMVTSKEIDKVLVICDKQYKEKADNRDGGVGIETQIITPKIYNQVKQEKFIPVIAEIDGEFESCMPNYMDGKIGVDLSNDNVFEYGYEELLRLIYNKPQYKKPQLGKKPSFLLQDDEVYFKTTNIVRQLKNALLNKPQQAEYFIDDFINEFFNELDKFKISYDETKKEGVIADEIICEKIDGMMILRNNYINILELLCKLKSDFDINIIIKLFENIYSYTQFQGSGTYSEVQFDQYKFFIREIFIYTISILLENRLFHKANILLQTRYFLKNKYDENNTGRLFPSLYLYVTTLDELRKNGLGINKISITADMLIKRSNINGKDYSQQIIGTDLLLHYISSIKNKNEVDYDKIWFPCMYIYINYYRNVEILQKMIRKNDFEQTKILFNVDNEEQMKELIKNYKNEYKGYNNSFESIPHISRFIDVDNIGKY